MSQLTRALILSQIEGEHMSEEGSNQMDSNKMGAGIAVGLPLGVALGVTMDNIGMGIAIGICIGVALGAGWSQS